MMFHKRSKIAFLLNPRCGSTSLREYLDQFGFTYPLIRINEEPYFHWHPTYEECVATYPALKQYQMYVIFRDPLDRFVSALEFALTIQSLKLSRAKSCDQVVDKLFRWDPTRTLLGIPGELFTPQVHWVLGDNVEVIPYNGFTERVREVVSVCGGLEKRIANYNVTSQKMLDAPSDAVRQFVSERFADDYVFGRGAGLLV
jgi:hypothetical protein